MSYISNRYSKANNKYLISYDPKQRWKHIIYLGTNNLYGYVMSKFVQTGSFKWIDTKEFDLNKYTSNSSKGCVLEVDLEYAKKLQELQELRNDYFLADTNQNRMLIYTLFLLVIYIYIYIYIYKTFHYQKCATLWKLATLLETRIKTKKGTLFIRIQYQSQWLKPYIEFNTKKRIEAEKNNDKDGKELYKLTNNAVYKKKTMENLGNRIDVKLVNNKKYYLKYTSKLYIIQNIWQ